MHRFKTDVRNKIKSNRGVSVTIALILFLVAAMVSAVIISAALTSFKSVHKEIDTQQNQLAVSSAARTIGEGLRHSSVIKTEVEVWGKDKEGNVIEPSSTVTFSYTGPLGPFLAEAMKIETPETHTMSIDSGAGAEGPDPCAFDFEIIPVSPKDPEEKYTMNGTVELDRSNKNYENGPRIYLKAYCSYQETTATDHPQGEDEKNITTHTEKWKWNTVWLNTTRSYDEE